MTTVGRGLRCCLSVSGVMIGPPIVRRLGSHIGPLIVALTQKAAAARCPSPRERVPLAGEFQRRVLSATELAAEPRGVESAVWRLMRLVRAAASCAMAFSQTRQALRSAAGRGIQRPPGICAFLSRYDQSATPSRPPSRFSSAGWRRVFCREGVNLRFVSIYAVVLDDGGAPTRSRHAPAASRRAMGSAS